MATQGLELALERHMAEVERAVLCGKPAPSTVANLHSDFFPDHKRLTEALSRYQGNSLPVSEGPTGRETLDFIGDKLR